ncbi:MAG TPA: hypothetical protein VGI54_06745 [Solirubrobacteraceae bacterium]
MTFLVHVEGAFVAAPGPSTDGVPRARSAAYRLSALSQRAAETAATQLLIAELAREGLRPVGPLSAAIGEPAPAA